MKIANLQRFWEIDVLRGIAIVLMAAFHVVFDLAYFSIFSVSISTGLWFYVGRFAAVMFIFLVGVSLSLRFSRSVKLKEKKSYKKYATRGLQILACGLLITIVTWFLIPQQFIVFGILHFIGVAILLSYPFLQLRNKNLVFGALCIALGFLVSSFTINNSWLLWLGIKPTFFASLDYVPLFPWFGVMLLGIWAGNHGYQNYQRQFHLPDLHGQFAMRILSFLGRHSLAIYLLHQPVIIFLLMLAGAHVPLLV
ncbi:MAG: DUF1624 domain-containing protein [Candidatus Aenigmarchaeota archaeon]|nr:DUF1624 domain-containing protein [Candidatus Aenigmarchaeota archaeon]